MVGRGKRKKFGKAVKTKQLKFRFKQGLLLCDAFEKGLDKSLGIIRYKRVYDILKKLQPGLATAKVLTPREKAAVAVLREALKRYKSAGFGGDRRFWHLWQHSMYIKKLAEFQPINR